MIKIGSDAFVLETRSHTALLTSSRLVLVDTAMDPSAENLISEIKACGYHEKDIANIIITHYHRDHTGGLERMKEITTAQIACHELETERIRQETGVKIDYQLKTQQVYQGLLVIHTPGHTKGHIALLDQETGLLVAGDSFMTNEEKIAPMPDQYNENPKLHRISMKKLLDYQFSKVIVAHGHPLLDSGHPLLKTAVDKIQY
ncbi:MAG: MBL fold metallo-hydrolase [Candidatus Heimdallarchaeota archaeon]